MHSRAFVVVAALLGCVPTFTPAQREAPGRVGRYALDLVDEAGNVLPTFQQRGRGYVLGTLGQRYLVRVRNESGRRAEVVVSVDGRDVIDGGAATSRKRGYLVEPWGELVVDGFRLDEAAVAAFRFSSVPRSYAARKGDARDVGVIGVAVFPEREPVSPPPQYEQPYLPYGSRLPPPAAEEAERHSTRGEAAPQTNAPALSGGAPEVSRDSSRKAERPGLGTEFGEVHGSPIQRVEFARARARPDAVLTLRYDDRAGLLALGLDVDGYGLAWRDDASLRRSAEPFRRDAGYSEPPAGWRGR
jgi:hypothetical protein